MNNIPVPDAPVCGNLHLVLNLTSHEQKVLIVVITLILLGVAARVYRHSATDPGARIEVQP